MSKKDLYFKSFEEFISKNNDNKVLNIEIQRFKYNKQEENRLKLIEEVKNLRNELKAKKKTNLKKSYSASYILTQGNKVLNNERMRYKFFENQQIGLMLNIIDREYKRDELEKKLELQNKMAMEREIEIKKMREKEKKEHDERDRLQALKMEKRAKLIKMELLKRAKEREEEDKKLMLKNELRKQAEERERKERQQEIKIKEEIQRKNLEELKIKKDKEIKERIKTTERRMQRALRIIQIKNKERDLKNQQYYNQKSELIKKQLDLQQQQAKTLMKERLIQTAIKREEVEENLKRKEALLKRNRLKLIYEINEKDKKINLAKSQRLRIWNEQKKLSRNFEENRERLLFKFREIMGKRRKKSKEQVISELLNNRTGECKTLSDNRLNKSQINQRNIKIIKENRNKNNNNKDDNVFITHLTLRNSFKDNNKINNS